ncbi:PREDICTED: probable receptor-like protein kinase At5g15080 [Camelina sativa]|uniref:Probable receptor-like protein kinase At5g15080 n=1 Tax=Camelina sativa TaxID=90675 RepID=A0ABM0Y618_CAMSA|nr:PREDICTED: probable receptor-like protein kinase At5g15080 [Camelina sativa]
MGKEETGAVKEAKGNSKSEKSKESENHRKNKKKQSNGDDTSRYHEEEEEEEEEEGEEASGCWVKFRFMIGCVPSSKSDLDASSSSICGTTSTVTTIESKSANEKSNDQPVAYFPKITILGVLLDLSARIREI